MTTSNNGMTIPEKMNAVKKTLKKKKIALKYTVKTENQWPQKGGSDTMLNISIDTPC